jgi:hypothetical protein
MWIEFAFRRPYIFVVAVLVLLLLTLFFFGEHLRVLPTINIPVMSII